MASPVRGLMRRLGRLTTLSLQGAAVLAVCWGGGVGVSAQAQEPDFVVEVIDFAPPSLQPLPRPNPLSSTLVPDPDAVFSVKTGKFNFPSAFDQIVALFAASGEGQDTRYLQLISLNTPPQPDPIIDYSDRECIYDFSVGNFDHRQPDPDFPQETRHNPNAQVALLYGGCGPGGKTIDILNVNLTNTNSSVWSRASSATLDTQFSDQSKVVMTQSDTQGRSLVLGSPTKVTVTGHIQPHLVLGIPPMHIDFIRDVNNLGSSGASSVLNLTVMPSLPAPATAFSTQFAFSSTASTTVSTNSTTSWGYSVGGSVSEKVTLGSPKAAFFSEQAKFAGKETHDNNVSDTYNTYQAVTTSLSATTGFADHLFFTESRHNI